MSATVLALGLPDPTDRSLRPPPEDARRAGRRPEEQEGGAEVGIPLVEEEEEGPEEPRAEGEVLPGDNRAERRRKKVGWHAPAESEQAGAARVAPRKGGNPGSPRCPRCCPIVPLGLALEAALWSGR